ncbi:MAG TPA: thermonuclease family protein [Sphingomicrobium sp.]|nr:thermonuclease family protein [Sphingomicrobium sp.]
MNQPRPKLPSYFQAPKRIRRGVVTLVLGAVFAGLVGAAAWQRWSDASRPPVDTSAIEWNAVQAVPTRAPDPEDIAWQQRAEAPLPEPVIANPANEPGEAIQSGLPRASGARNDGIYVIDGDTFEMGGQRIRVAGIDAPETHPPRCMDEAWLGLAATEKLKQLLSSGNVTISGSGHDQYGRDLRQVSVDGVDVAQTMIAAGLASSYSGGKRQWWC